MMKQNGTSRESSDGLEANFSLCAVLNVKLPTPWLYQRIMCLDLLTTLLYLETEAWNFHERMSAEKLTLNWLASLFLGGMSPCLTKVLSRQSLNGIRKRTEMSLRWKEKLWSTDILQTWHENRTQKRKKNDYIDTSVGVWKLPKLRHLRHKA